MFVGDFASNPIRCFRPLLADVYRHFGKGHRALDEIARLETLCERERHPIRSQVAFHMLIALDGCNWRCLPRKFVLDSIRRLPSISGQSGFVESMGELWNFQLAIELARAGYLVIPECPAPAGSRRQCDMFMMELDCPVTMCPPLDPNLLPPLSIADDRHGILMPGIAWECKSVSRRNFARELRDSASLLAEFQGGIVAFDVSSQVAEHLNSSNATTLDAYAVAASKVLESLAASYGRTFQSVASQDANNARRRGMRRSAIASGIGGILFYCRCLSRALPAAGNPKYSYHFDVSRAIYIHIWDFVGPVDSLPGESSRLAGEVLGRRVRFPMATMCYETQTCTILESGESLAVLFDQGHRPSIVRSKRTNNG